MSKNPQNTSSDEPPMSEGSEAASDTGVQYRGRFQHLREGAMADEDWRAPNTKRSLQSLGGAESEPQYSHPSFRSGTGIPVKGAASTDFNKGAMPKNFSQPLTCFFWYKYGKCNKSDAECVYAHYHTGVVASAPVHLGEGIGAAAGRNAMQQLEGHAEREKQLKEREAMLDAREMQLNGVSAYLNQNSIGQAIRIMYQTIAQTRGKVMEAHSTLESSRDAVAGGQKSGVEAIDAAMAVMTDLEKEFVDTATDLADRIGVPNDF